MFLMLTLYMQQVLGYSPMKTGLAYLAVAGTAILWSAVAAQLVTRLGVKPALVVGMTALSAGLLLHADFGRRVLSRRPPARLPADRRRHRLLVRADLDRRARRRSPSEAGLASGLINTSQQIGGALGVAALSAVATATTSDAIAG